MSAAQQQQVPQNIAGMMGLLSGPVPPLAPELERCKGSFGKGAACIQHPLVYAVPYFGGENALLNMRLAEAKRRLAEAIAKGDWARAVFTHERAYRVDALERLASNMRDRDYWRLVGLVWVDTENFWQNKRAWRRLFTGAGRSKSLRPLLMTRDERRALASLPDTLTVYRGVSRKDAAHGLSWTLDLRRARWFASRLLRSGQTPLVYQRTVSKSEVVAHFTGRSESEIVLLSRGEPVLMA